MLKFPLKYKNALRPVYNFAAKKNARLYLVGGILRDLLLGREKENPDFDFCIKRGALSFGKKLAKEIRAGFVVLDKEHGACRLVKRIGAKVYTFDFTDFRGKDLKSDLLHRDFTINSLALELKEVFARPDLDGLLIDPKGARQDLKDKIIRLAGSGSFSEDPLRILRAFSFAYLLGFSLDKDVIKSAKAEKDKLPKVSFERIRDELFKIFSSACAYECFLELDKLKIIKIIFPETEKMRGIGQGPYHHLDVWQHTLETMRQLEIVLKGIRRRKEIDEFLGEVLSAERSRFALLKFAAFLHDVGKPATLRREKGKITFHGHERAGLRIAADIAQRLKLSNDEIRALKSIIICHLRPGYLADSEKPTARAKFRFFRDAGKESISVLLLSIADQRATKGPLTTLVSRTRHEKAVAMLLKEYMCKAKEKKPLRLVDGHAVMRRFKLLPSPVIGKILARIEELQAIGAIKTKEEAFKAAEKILRRIKPGGEK